MLSYIQLILLLSSLLSSPTTITSTYSTLFNASTLVLIVALPFLVSYYSTPIRIETALFDTTAIDDYFDNLIIDSDNNTENIIDDADLSATVDDGSADESNNAESIIDDLSGTTDVSSLEDRDYPTDDSCIDLDLNFMDDAEADDAWEAMKAAAGCGNVDAQEDEETFVAFVDRDADWTPGSKAYKPKKAKAELAPFADERYFSESESEDDWSDDEGSMCNPFDIADNYDAGQAVVPRAGIVLGNTKDMCDWFDDKTWDAPIARFTLKPTCNKNLDGTPIVDEEEDEAVEIEDVWGYEDAEDEQGNVQEGWKVPARLVYMKELWPMRAREIYAAWWET